MSIVSVPFAVFLCVVLCVFYGVPRRFQNLVLLAASFVFCATWDARFVLILAAFTVFNFLVPKFYSRKPRDPRNWPLLGIGIGINLSIWCLCRVSGLLDPTGDGVSGLAIPIGISFYVLSAISYLVDVHRGQTKRVTGFVEFALFMAYFPKLIAGPIERAASFIPQLSSARVIDNASLERSAMLIIIGLLRKVVVANWLFGLIPSAAWTHPETFNMYPLLVFPAVYLIALYNDFLGYMNIMRGISILFGIELTQNFNLPLSSHSLTDFWTRWHISLSNWLRDYIFYPLTRFLLKRRVAPESLLAVGAPVVVTMVASGIWHGFGWNFVAWGLLLGSFQTVERLVALKARNQENPRSHRVSRTTSVLVMLLAMILFKTSIDVFSSYVTAMVTPSNILRWDNLVLSIWIAAPIVASLTLDRLNRDDGEAPDFTSLSGIARPSIIALAVFLILMVSGADSQSAFVYQEF